MDEGARGGYDFQPGKTCRPPLRCPAAIDPADGDKGGGPEIHWRDEISSGRRSKRRRLRCLSIGRARSAPSRAQYLFVAAAEAVGPAVSTAGRPRLPIRLMVALLHLKHAHNDSDESVFQPGAQAVYLQLFIGQVCFEPRLSCEDSQSGGGRRPFCYRASASSSLPPLSIAARAALIIKCRPTFAHAFTGTDTRP